MNSNKKTFFDYAFFLLFNIYIMLLFSAFGSNLYIQRHENISGNILNTIKGNENTNFQLFIKYSIHNSYSWQPDLFMPNTDMLLKFQKDFKEEEVITTGFYTSTEKSVPLLLSNSLSAPQYSALVTNSTEQLGLNTIVGNSSISFLMPNVIAISKVTADQLLSLEENTGKTYADLIGTNVVLYSSLNYELFENSYKIASIFLDNESSLTYEKYLDKKFIIVSNMTALPGSYGFNFNINGRNIITLQRLFAYIDKYLSLDQFFYDVSAHQHTSLKAMMVDSSFVIEIQTFESLVYYYKSNESILVSLFILGIIVLFFVNLNLSISSINNGFNSTKILYFLLTISLLISLLIISALKIVNIVFSSLYLLNYYSLIFITLFYAFEIILIYTCFKKARRERMGEGKTNKKPIIIQQVTHLAQSSGLTKDYKNMIESPYLLSKYDFKVVSSSKKGPLRMIIDYYRQISKIESRIIIIRGAGPESLWPSIAARLADKKIILAIHGMWSDLKYISRIKKWISKNFVEYMLLKLCDTFYTVYEGAIKKEGLKQFNDKYYGCIYNPVSEKTNDYVTTRPDISKIKRQEINGLFVGRITREKGIMFLLEGLVELYSNKKYSNFKMYFIGGGPDLEYFESVVKAKELNKNVFFLGEKSDIQDYYKKSHIFIFPSLHENFPNAILEAIDNNLFILSTNVGGIPEILKNREGCLLIPPADTSELLLSLKTILNNKYYLKVEHSTYLAKKNLFSRNSFEENIEKLINNSLYDLPKNKFNKEVINE